MEEYPSALHGFDFTGDVLLGNYVYKGVKLQRKRGIGKRRISRPRTYVPIISNSVVDLVNKKLSNASMLTTTAVDNTIYF